METISLKFLNPSNIEHNIGYYTDVSAVQDDVINGISKKIGYRLTYLINHSQHGELHLKLYQESFLWGQNNSSYKKTTEIKTPEHLNEILDSIKESFPEYKATDYYKRHYIKPAFKNDKIWMYHQ